MTDFVRRQTMCNKCQHLIGEEPDCHPVITIFKEVQISDYMT